MIYSIIGQCGGGKTLLMTILAHQEHLKGMPVYANYKLTFPFSHLTSAFFRDYSKFPIFKACVCFDELSMYYSARRSASKQNLALKPFILQTRKRTLKLFYTAQQTRLVDINIRENTDGLYMVDMYVKHRGKFILKPEDYEGQADDEYLLIYKYYNRDGIMLRNRVIPHAERYFSLYDTYEIIQFDEQKKELKQ